MSAVPPDNPFLRAVIAHPDDDLTRLVYADWLDENGRPERAEFIRVQVALAAGVTDPDRHPHLETRQRELLVAHDREWVCELADVLECPPGRWGGWVFRRGFVEYFHLPAATVAARGASLAALTPVRELYLNPTQTVDVVTLCRQPWLASVRDLYLLNGSSGLQTSGVTALITSRHTTGLKKLVVRLAPLVRANTELYARFVARFRGIWQG
ncbi:MAG: TIGR02996 domain-containing protein [Fimbriiglobus sp.]|nr:TIGR02996 domain-containing protein [Fimbriiglobus sp.]